MAIAALANVQPVSLFGYSQLVQLVSRVIRMKALSEFLAGRLEDPEFRREYEASRPEFEALKAQLKAELAAEAEERHEPCAAEAAA